MYRSLMLKSIRTTLCVASLVLLAAAMMTAQVKPKGAHVNAKPDRGSVVLFSNFEGAYPFWDTANEYEVDGPLNSHQTLAQGFTPRRDATFSDVALAMGRCTTCGSAYRRVNVYLEDDAGGVPGSIIDGPLTQQHAIRGWGNGQGGSLVLFNCVTCPALSAGTRYWIVAQQDHYYTIDYWDWSLSDTSTDFAFSFDQGGAPRVRGTWFPPGTRGAPTKPTATRRRTAPL
jgi:hypothetical protein